MSQCLGEPQVSLTIRSVVCRCWRKITKINAIFVTCQGHILAKITCHCGWWPWLLGWDGIKFLYLWSYWVCLVGSLLFHIWLRKNVGVDSPQLKSRGGGRQAAMSQLEFRSRIFSKDPWVKACYGEVVGTLGGGKYERFLEFYQSVALNEFMEWVVTPSHLADHLTTCPKPANQE